VLEKKQIKEWITLENICKAAKLGEGTRPGLEVAVEKKRAVMEGDRPDFIRDPRVTIRVSRGKATLFLDGAEFHELLGLMQTVEEQAMASARACDEEVAKLRASREEVRKLRDEMRAKKASEGFGDASKPSVRVTGKTERKKANGKAGEAYHRKKKSEHAEQSKQVAASMGHNK
jgi:hypothetical protein